MYYLHVHRIVAPAHLRPRFPGWHVIVAIPNLTFELELLLVSSNDQEFDSGIIYEFPSSVMLTLKRHKLRLQITY